MEFGKTLPTVVSAFQAAGIQFALIGGLAIAFHGIQRTTLDADFILLIDDLDTAHDILLSQGYERRFHSENVSHYLSENPALGRIDILHAFRPTTIGMLKRSQILPLTTEIGIPVVSQEDIIGLKIQAAHNDPSRQRSDWNDIFSIVEHAARQQSPLDWPRISEFLELFGLSGKLSELQSSYASTKP